MGKPQPADAGRRPVVYTVEGFTKTHPCALSLRHLDSRSESGGLMHKSRGCRFEAEGLRVFHWTFAIGLGLLCMCKGMAASGDTDEIGSVSEALCRDMTTHHVMTPHAPVACDRLRLLRFAYVGFDQHLHQDGEVIVLDAVADDVLQAFVELRQQRFPIAKARLMNAYEGNDDASTADNNTSAFNDRPVAGGGRASLHGYGVAIDLNPVQNPYLTRSGATLTVSPASGAEYINRMRDRPGKAQRAGMAEEAIDVFANHGLLIWGGYWDDPIDYQHFDVGRALAEKLVNSSPGQARELFARHVAGYAKCRHEKPGEAGRSACISAQSQ